MQTQIEIAEQISNILKKAGLETTIEKAGCCIDNVVEVGTLKKRNHTKGIVRVFWSSTQDFKIGYLGAGEPFSDGYEIHRSWINNISLKEVVGIVKADIVMLAKFHKTQSN